MAKTSDKSKAPAKKATAKKTVAKKTAAKKPVKNKDLWQALDEACARHEIKWVWVKGHAGDEGNEKADELARRGAEEARG